MCHPCLDMLTGCRLRAPPRSPIQAHGKLGQDCVSTLNRLAMYQKSYALPAHRQTVPASTDCDRIETIAYHQQTSRCEPESKSRPRGALLVALRFVSDTVDTNTLLRDWR